MRQVARGTKVTREESVNGNVVTKDVVTLNKATDATYADTWELDFSDVERKDLLILATRSLVIELQSAFRGCKAAKVDDWDELSLNVAEHLANKRKKLTPEERQKRAIAAVKAAGVSVDALKDMIADMESDEE